MLVEFYLKEKNGEQVEYVRIQSGLDVVDRPAKDEDRFSRWPKLYAAFKAPPAPAEAPAVAAPKADLPWGEEPKAPKAKPFGKIFKKSDK